MDRSEIPLYINHEGTVLISGSSEPGKASRYVIHLLEAKVGNIEIMFIGANAGQQAYKVCAIAQIIAVNELDRRIVFETVRARTKTEKRDITGKVVVSSGEVRYESRDAYIWRVVEIGDTK